MVINHRIVNLINLWTAVITISLGFQTIGYAQESRSSDQQEQQSNDEQPTVSLRMLLVEETLACRPSGYGSINECKIWTVQEVNDLIGERLGQLILAQGSVPPGEFNLGDSLFVALTNYVGSAEPISASRRKAILIVFDFGTPQGTEESPTPVSISRQSPEDTSSIGSRTYRGFLRGNQRWIYHERASLYYPGEDVQWALCLGGTSSSCEGGSQWVYRMRP